MSKSKKEKKITLKVTQEQLNAIGNIITEIHSINGGCDHSDLVNEWVSLADKALLENGYQRLIRL